MKTKELNLYKPTKTLYTKFHLWNLKRSKKQIAYKIVNSLINETDEWVWLQTSEDGERGLLRNEKKNIHIRYEFIKYPCHRDLDLTIKVGEHILESKDINRHHLKHCLDILGVSDRVNVVKREKLESIKNDVMSNLDK